MDGDHVLTSFVGLISALYSARALSHSHNPLFRINGQLKGNTQTAIDSAEL